MDARGRPPTRGEVKQLSEAVAVSADVGTTLQHTCWTYWGHSGAPLFDEAGGVCGLHASWDRHVGMRHAQKLDRLHWTINTNWDLASSSQCRWVDKRIPEVWPAVVNKASSAV